MAATRRMYLDRAFTYQGKNYGPGEVDVPEEADQLPPFTVVDAKGQPVKLRPADDITAAQRRAIEIDIREGRREAPPLSIDMDVKREPGAPLPMPGQTPPTGPASFDDGSITTLGHGTHNTNVPTVTGAKMGRLIHESIRDVDPEARPRLGGATIDPRDLRPMPPGGRPAQRPAPGGAGAEQGTGGSAAQESSRSPEAAAAAQNYAGGDGGQQQGGQFPQGQQPLAQGGSDTGAGKPAGGSAGDAKAADRGGKK